MIETTRQYDSERGNIDYRSRQYLVKSGWRYEYSTVCDSWTYQKDIGGQTYVVTEVRMALRIQARLDQ